MASLAVERLESLLQTRKLDATLAKAPVAPPAVAATGIATLDEVLSGGWRRGEISEIVGTRSSGRTALLVASLAAAVHRGEVVGLVDTFDRFDPPSAAAAGLPLASVLWVRGPAVTHVRPAGRRPAGGAALIDGAVQRAVRAADLLIRAGGFGIVALDLADVPPQTLRSLPWTTWRRLAHGNEGRDTAVLLLAESPLGRSARGATLRVTARPRWTGTSPQTRRFDALDLECAVVGAAMPTTSASRLHRIRIAADGGRQ
jgi:hypothetical protein